MNPPHPEPVWRRDWPAWAVIASVFVLLAAASWRCWPDFLVDFGHELYVPWRLAEGEVLYRDLIFTMGPLSQYFNALLFRALGVSLSTLIAANLTILAAITTLLYWLFRQVAPRWSATFVVLFFLAVFAFGQLTLIGNYNYVCPYRHEVTHGMALGLACIAALVRYDQTYRRRCLAFAGICLGLIALTKVEMLFPAAVATAAAVWLVPARRPAVAAGPPVGKARQRLTDAALALVCAAIPVALAVALLAIPLGAPGAARELVQTWSHPFNPALTVNSGFYQALAGWDRPFESLLQMLLSMGVVLAAIFSGMLLELLLRGRVRSSIPAVVIAIFVGLGSLRMVSGEQWGGLPVAVPPLILLVTIVTWVQASRSAAASSGLSLCLLSLYGLCLLPKMLLATGWGHYGFVLAMPATLVLIHVALFSLPDFLRKQRFSGRYFRALAAGLLAGCGLAHALSWIAVDHGKTLAIGDGGDRFYANAERDNRILPTAMTLEYLREHMHADETLVVIPEGTTFNYLLKKRNPTGFLMVTPWEFDAHGGEQRFVDRLVESRPDFVVLITMDMTIHGRGNFGGPQYGQATSEILDKEYQVVDGQGSIDPRDQSPFQSIVYQRRQ